MDGVSDQGLTGWAGVASEDSNLAAHIKLARYVVQWDAMSGAGYPEELANLERWYDSALALGLTPELALENYNCNGCAPPQGAAAYSSALAALLRSFPRIAVVEAWNEPNDSHYSSYVPPATAAAFMNAAYEFCAGYSCTAIAGDLLDSEANMVEYERQYERYLIPHDPGNWGIHPYHAVKYMTDSTVASFQAALPDPATDSIWFTEVGAYYCEAEYNYGEGAQEHEARFLVDNLMPKFQPAHVFYYELASPYDEPSVCNSEQDDTALYVPRSTNGPLLARGAASAILGPQQSPSEHTLNAGAATQTQTSYLACEPTLDEQWQHGECLYLRELFEA